MATDSQRLLSATMKMQSGVAHIQAHNAQHSPGFDYKKDFRVGLNTVLSGQGGLVKLLIEKGVITQEEVAKALANAMEYEVTMMETELSSMHGANIKLGEAGMETS